MKKDLFNYSNKVIGRNYKVIYYDCTNYFFYTGKSTMIPSEIKFLKDFKLKIKI